MDSVIACANEYEAMLGVNALDCDGPSVSYILAAPTLVIYGVGFAFNGMRWKRRINLAAASLCLIVCGAVLANVVRAAIVEREQRSDCALQTFDLR